MSKTIDPGTSGASADEFILARPQGLLQTQNGHSAEFHSVFARWIVVADARGNRLPQMQWQIIQ